MSSAFLKKRQNNFFVRGGLRGSAGVGRQSLRGGGRVAFSLAAAGREKASKNETSVTEDCRNAVVKGTRLLRASERPSSRVLSAITERATTTGERRTANGERRTANGERRTANGERRTANGERQTANGKRRTANGERRIISVLLQLFSQNC